MAATVGVLRVEEYSAPVLLVPPCPKTHKVKVLEARCDVPVVLGVVCYFAVEYTSIVASVLALVCVVSRR